MGLGARILVIDPGSSGLRSLTDDGFEVSIVTTGASARVAIEHNPPDLIVLSERLPDTDGIALCRWLRVWPGAPIIALVSHDDEQTQLALFAAGADDVVVRPVSLELLRARITVQLRHQTPPFASRGGRIVVGALHLDVAAFEADVGGRQLNLTLGLFNLLRVLAHNVDVVVALEAIARAMGQADDSNYGNAIRIGISRLRRRIGTGPDVPRIINEPKVGYRLVSPGSPS